MMRLRYLDSNTCSSTEFYSNEPFSVPEGEREWELSCIWSGFGEVSCSS